MNSLEFLLIATGEHAHRNPLNFEDDGLIFDAEHGPFLEPGLSELELLDSIARVIEYA